MPSGYDYEKGQAALRATWRRSFNALLKLDEQNLLGSNPEYRTLMRQLEHQYATLTPSDAVTQLRAALTAPGAPSVRFLRITGGT